VFIIRSDRGHRRPLIQLITWNNGRATQQSEWQHFEEVIYTGVSEKAHIVHLFVSLRVLLA
jgi:hypothetical protein